MATRRPTPAALARTGHVAIAKRHARLKTLLARVANLKRTIARSFYALGVALREIHDDKLHTALGLASFDALLAEHIKVPHTTAYELMAVARALPSGIATKLGAAKAYDLVRYAAGEHRAVATVAKGSVAKRSTREIKAATSTRSSKSDPERKRADVARTQAAHRLTRAGVEARVDVRRRGKAWNLVVELGVDDAMLIAPTV